MSIPSPLFNCRQATLLVERRADEALPHQARVQLWAHLRLCPYCQRYAVQSMLLARQAGLTAAALAASADVTLPQPARARLQLLLDSRGATGAAAQPE